MKAKRLSSRPGVLSTGGSDSGSSRSLGPAKLARKRIVVVEDHPMTRAGLVQLINQQPDLEVYYEATRPAEVISAISHDCPDLLITDLTMPGGSGIELIKDVVALQPTLPILVT